MAERRSSAAELIAPAASTTTGARRTATSPRASTSTPVTERPSGEVRRRKRLDAGLERHVAGQQAPGAGSGSPRRPWHRTDTETRRRSRSARRRRRRPAGSRPAAETGAGPALCRPPTSSAMPRIVRDRPGAGRRRERGGSVGSAPASPRVPIMASAMCVIGLELGVGRRARPARPRPRARDPQSRARAGASSRRRRPWCCRRHSSGCRD